MRTLGVDWGEARIGLALSDPMGIIATPHGTLEEKDKGAQVRLVAQLVVDQDVQRIVVGLPLELDGTHGPTAQMAEKYAQRLEEVTGLQVHRWDERLTSAAAERTIRELGGKKKKKKGRRDKGEVDTIAACILLQSFLDAPTPIL